MHGVKARATTIQVSVADDYKDRHITADNIGRGQRGEVHVGHGGLLALVDERADRRDAELEQVLADMEHG